MTEKLIHPLANGGGWGESKGPEIALNVNPKVIRNNIENLEPRLRDMAIKAIREELDDMQGIQSEDQSQQE
jgi:hypothetical protein